MTNVNNKNIEFCSQGATLYLSKNLANISTIEKYAQLGQISSGLIHDLTSPITSLNIQLDLLNEETFKNPEFIKSIKQAIINIDNYAKLIKEYISGDKTKKKIYLDKEIQKTIEMISYNAIKQNIQIQFIRENNISIYTCPIDIYQITISLISNAIEAFREKDQNRKIILKLYQNKKYICFSIQDFGEGIEDTDIIFEKFYTTKKDRGGTGIGLSSVKYIVENNLMGKIKIKSKKDYGSIFTVYISKNLSI